MIDGGSTHNFIQEQLAQSPGLRTTLTNPLRVMVGNGNQIECRQLCEEVLVHIQNQSFTVDLHVLPLCGTNLILGARWPKSLGPVLTDYNDLIMKFMHVKKIIELKGNSDIGLHLITPPQLR